MNKNRFTELFRKVTRLSGQSLNMICYYPISLFYKNKEKYKDMWLISERGNEAKDNGYVFFKYLRENHPEINSYYLMDSSKEIDYNKIKNLGNIIEYGSFEHKIAFLLCEKAICTHIGFLEPWSYKLYKLILDRKNKKQFVFLQHGIILHDLSEDLNKASTKINLFITTTTKEHKSIRSNVYGYENHEVAQTGIARLDNLYNYKAKNQIVLMPTWRKDIVNPSYLKHKVVDDSIFLGSEYFERFNSLINNKRLQEILKYNNCELIFYPHYEVQQYIKYFKSSCEKVIVASKENYDVQTLLKESKLLITDYSSVAFDFAYMEKPMIYYQFDELDHYKNGYFNYDEDGFGSIVEQEKDLVDLLDKYIKNKFDLEPVFKDRIESTFNRRDNKNCERIFESIKSI